MVHECLTIASALGHFHQWQRWVELGDRDKREWTKVPVVNKGDFCYKYSMALILMGSVQHPAYSHPKMLGCYFDNVYHQGHFIGDLPALGKNPTEAQTKRVYDQEYEEVIARIENSLDLSLQGMVYQMIPTSLLNPKIVLPPKVFREREGLPEVPLDCIPQPLYYMFDGAQGLVDLSWEQWVPLIQPDDVNKDPLYNQYPYEEADDYHDKEEEMEIDDRMLGNAGDTRLATPTGTQHPYHRPPASYTTYSDQAPGSPRSIHMDTDMALEFNTLQVVARNVPPQGPAKELTAPDLVNHLTKVMANAATEVIDGLACPLPVTDATDATLQERFMQRRAAAQHSGTTPAATGQVSVFDWLAHRQQSPQMEDTWQTRLEMMPWKVTEQGRQLERGQEPGRSTSRVPQESGQSTSQKRHSQSHPQDKADSKKGRTEDGTSQGRKVQIGIDWANTGIQSQSQSPTHNILLSNWIHLGLRTVCLCPDEVFSFCERVASATKSVNRTPYDNTGLTGK